MAVKLCVAQQFTLTLSKGNFTGYYLVFYYFALNDCKWTDCSLVSSVAFNIHLPSQLALCQSKWLQKHFLTLLWIALFFFFFSSLCRLWLCTFTLSVAVCAVLLLPISILSNEVLLTFPHSYYMQWLNGSLIRGKNTRTNKTKFALHMWFMWLYHISLQRVNSVINLINYNFIRFSSSVLSPNLNWNCKWIVWGHKLSLTALC